MARPPRFGESAESSVLGLRFIEPQRGLVEHCQVGRVDDKGSCWLAMEMHVIMDRETESLTSGGWSSDVHIFNAFVLNGSF